MHSYILNTNSNQEQYLKSIRLLLKYDTELKTLNNPDVILIGGDDQSIKIEQIRELKSLNVRLPVQSQYVVVIIAQAHLMTTQSQNAILKLLEEPTESSRIFLVTNNTHALLPTIISRCQIIRENELPHTILSQSNIFEITSEPLTKRMVSIEPYTKDRETASSWLLNAITTCQQTLHNQHHLSVSTYIQHLQTAYSDLQNNVNVKLTMDNLVLNLEKTHCNSGSSRYNQLVNISNQ